MEPSSLLKYSTSSPVIDDLPKREWWGFYELYKWNGHWYHLPHVVAAMAAQSRFQARDDDVILASSMKTGTTWLKALIPTIISLAHRDDDGDPLAANHPNALMPSLEVQIFRDDLDSPQKDDVLAKPSPRLFRTHIPYGSLAESIKSSDCKIVYVTRDPKDVFISLWHFVNPRVAYPVVEAFDEFCQGLHPFGPFHDHVLEYWTESLKRPNKILFMRYEEMKREPTQQVQRLAAFLGRPSMSEEEVDTVLSRCSIDRLKSLEINKNGVDPWVGIPYRTYFRLGQVGDWKNSLTAEMKHRLDGITSAKLEGSGLAINSR